MKSGSQEKFLHRSKIAASGVLGHANLGGAARAMRLQVTMSALFNRTCLGSPATLGLGMLARPATFSRS